MKLTEAQTKLEELKGIATPTDEQKAELATLDSFVKEETAQVSRFDELSKKDENLLTSEEVDEYLSLSEKFKAAEPIKGGKADDQPAASGKKYAGIYDSPEALLDGLLSSEAERKRISEECKNDPLLAEKVEELYKDSQRKVTKVVEIKKSRPTIKPLGERLMHEMTEQEWKDWEAKDKLAATAWLTTAKPLYDQQAKSAQAVFAKHPEFYAMQRGVVPPSEKFLKFLEVEKEHLEWAREPNASEKILAEVERSLETPPKVEDKPKPKKEAVKPDIAAGKTSGTPHKGRKLSAEEFEKLSDADQRAYMEGSLTF